MKKGRFLWSAHRITKKQKAGKARNIKEKQLKNSRNTVSKQLVALRSPASVNLFVRFYTTVYAQDIFPSVQRENQKARSASDAKRQDFRV